MSIDLSPMRHETRFWEGLLQGFNSGWRVSVEPERLNAGSGPLSDLTVRVYVVDTSSGWLGGAGLSAQDMQAAADAARSFGLADAICGDAPDALLQAIETGSRDEASKTKEVTRIALLALTQTRTFERLAGSPDGLSGHWLYLVYKTRAGFLLGRPVFQRDRTAGSLLTRERLLALARQVVHSDLLNPDGHVGSQIIEGEGLELARAFR